MEFVWLKDGVKVDANRRLQVKQISETASTLTIPEVGAEDIANYTCAVSNAAGSDSVTSQLVVTCESSDVILLPVNGDINAWCSVNATKEQRRWWWW